MSHELKQYLSLAGEFAVAAELNLQGISASVSYGTSKNADVVAFGERNKLARIEVKATDKSRWPLGNKVTQPTPKESNSFWVLVHFQGRHSLQQSKMFVMTHKEIHEIWRSHADEYERKYERKNGKKFAGIGVPNVTLAQLEGFEERQWQKVKSFLA